MLTPKIELDPMMRSEVDMHEYEFGQVVRWKNQHTTRSTQIGIVRKIGAGQWELEHFENFFPEKIPVAINGRNFREANGEDLECFVNEMKERLEKYENGSRAVQLTGELKGHYLDVLLMQIKEEGLRQFRGDTYDGKIPEANRTGKYLIEPIYENAHVDTNEVIAEQLVIPKLISATTAENMVFDLLANTRKNLGTILYTHPEFGQLQNIKVYETPGFMQERFAGAPNIVHLIMPELLE